MIAGIAVVLIASGLGVCIEAAIGFASTTPPLFRLGLAISSALALAYQLGSLLAPTLVPIALWFWAAAEDETVLAPASAASAEADA